MVVRISQSHSIDLSTAILIGYFTDQRSLSLDEKVLGKVCPAVVSRYPDL